jgi:hypothetical protein
LNTKNLSVYFINDTVRFKINSSTGVINNNTVLAAATYRFNISVNDTSNNILSIIFTLEITDPGAASSSSSGGGGGGTYSTTTTLSSESSTINLDQDDKVAFNIGSNSHKVQLKGVYTDYIIVTVFSIPIDVSLFPGVTEKVDVDNDNILDLAMTLEKIYTKSAKIKFEKIEEAVPQQAVAPPVPPQPEPSLQVTPQPPPPPPSPHSSEQIEPVTPEKIPLSAPVILVSALAAAILLVVILTIRKASKKRKH